MARYKTYEKDPEAVLDYTVDFAPKTNGREDAVSDYLQDGETISSYSVISSSPAALVVDSYSLANSSTAVVFWLSGGVAGTDYLVTVHIVTSSGREDDRTLRIIVGEK